MLPSSRQSRDRKQGIYKSVVLNKKAREELMGVMKRLESLKNTPIYVYEVRVIYSVNDEIAFVLPFRFRGREYEIKENDIELLYVKSLQKIAELQGNY